MEDGGVGGAHVRSLSALPVRLFTRTASLSESYLSEEGEKPPSGPGPPSPLLVAGL